RARLRHVAGEVLGRGGMGSQRGLRARAGRRADDELAVLEQRDRARVGTEKLPRLLGDLVEHGARVELRREATAGPRDLLLEHARGPLALEQVAALERGPRA